MKTRFLTTVGLLVVAACGGQSSHFEMPMVGERLPVGKIQFVNRIPKAQLTRLPTVLQVLRYSTNARGLPREALQLLLDQSVFAGTNIASLLDRRTDPTEHLRLATPNNRDYFSVNPGRGGVVLHNPGGDIDLKQAIPPPDAVPSFEFIRERLLGYAKAFGVNTNEIERKDDGSIALHKQDGQRIARGGAIKFMHRRSVALSRSVAGHAILMNDDKIELELGVDGRLLRFELKWPPMEPVSTNTLLTIDKVMREIEAGNVLGGVMNEYPSGGIRQVELKQLRIDYYDTRPANARGLSTNALIGPVASIFAVFKSEQGRKTEGTIYAPIIDSR